MIYDARRVIRLPFVHVVCVSAALDRTGVALTFPAFNIRKLRYREYRSEYNYKTKGTEERMSRGEDDVEYRGSLFSAFVEDHKGFGLYRDEEQQDDVRRRRRSQLVLSIILLMVLAIAGGWWLHVQATPPLDKITTTSVR
jgi:hypothetical protein